MGSAAIFFLMLGVAFALIAIHEVGHYLAGRMAGIPRGEMRIRLLAFPQHVEVRDGDTWCSPVKNMPRYIEVTAQYLTTRGRAFCYVAGGLVVEGLVVTVVTIVFVALHWSLLAFWTPVISLAIYFSNALLQDLPWAIKFGHPAGNTSGLWSLAKWPAVAVVAFTIGLRGILIWAAVSSA